MADTTLNARGLGCPLPILKTRKALRGLPVGATLEVLTTDPLSLEDFPVFCRLAGHDLLDARQVDDAFCFVIKKCRDEPVESQCAK